MRAASLRRNAENTGAQTSVDDVPLHLGRSGTQADFGLRVGLHKGSFLLELAFNERPTR